METFNDEQKLHVDILRAEQEAYRKLETWGTSLFLGAIGLVAKQLVEWTRASNLTERIDLPNSFIFTPATLGLLAFIYLRIVNYRSRDVTERLYKLAGSPERNRRRAFGWFAWFLSIIPIVLGYYVSWALAPNNQNQESPKNILIICLIVVLIISFIVHTRLWWKFNKSISKPSCRSSGNSIPE
jgi:hypothetical protein